MSGNFPSLSQITPFLRQIFVYYKNEFQYVVNTEQQINNLRVWALKYNECHNFTFVWQEHHIGMTEKGELTKYPNGLFDVEQKQTAQIVRLRREQFDHESLENFVN